MRLRLLALAIVTLGCGPITPPSDITITEFTIAVDSISGPTAVSGGIGFDSRLWGTVGPTACYSYKELRTTRVPAQIDVTVIGEQSSDVTCVSGTVKLNGVILHVDPTIPNQFKIVVHQPNGTTLTRNILGE